MCPLRNLISACFFFFVLLKRADASRKDIVNFCCTVIRPVLEYCSPIFHHSLPEYLSEDLDHIQKSVLSIISPEQSYSQCLDSFGLSTLCDKRNDHCAKLFNSIYSGQHSLAHLLPQKHRGWYNIRNKGTYEMPQFYTECFKQSFIPAMCG